MSRSRNRRGLASGVGATGGLNGARQAESQKDACWDGLEGWPRWGSPRQVDGDMGLGQHSAARREALRLGWPKQAEEFGDGEGAGTCSAMGGVSPTAHPFSFLYHSSTCTFPPTPLSPSASPEWPMP